MIGSGADSLGAAFFISGFFFTRLTYSNREAAQMAMAKATGQFKHGNERVSRKTAKGRG